MKKIIFIAFLFLTIGINAQINKANVYGYKEITTTQRDALTVPSGQFWTIYNITNNRPERWNGSAWVSSLDAATLAGQNGAYYLNWNNFTNTPSSLSGYGITDAYTKTESDANFYPLGSNPAGYLTSETDPIYSASSWFSTTNNSSNWNTAYSWGDHSLAGYASDSDVVHLTGSETITGTKTFNANTGIMTNTTTGSGYFGINTGSGQSIRVINNGSGRGILVDGGASSTGKLFEGQNNSATTFSVDKTGIVTANQFKKPFGVSTEFLKADGSVDSNTYLTTTGNGSGLTNVDAATLAGQNGAYYLNWNNFTNTPSSLSGYGITDAYTKSETDSKYLLNTTDTLTGDLTVTGTGVFSGAGDSSFEGSLGIGITTPQEKLHIYQPTGTIRQEIESGNNSSAIYKMTNSSGANGLLIDSNNRFNIFDYTTAQIRVLLNNSTGNVSIGNTNNTYKLDVSGTGRFTGDVTIPAEAYSSSMDGIQEAVTKDAFYDQVRPYKTYVALVSQTSTNAPVPTVLENTLGSSPTWSRVSTGVYRATITDLFDITKTVVFIKLQQGVAQTDIVRVSVQNNNDDIQISTHNSSNTLSDGIMAKTSLEIRVYP